MRLQIGHRLVGNNEPALLVAELGINHGGSIDTALEMVRAAVGAGTEAIKIQAFESSSFCTEAATYQGERQLDMFRRYELGAVELSAIADECRRLGVMFFGTPDSIERARLLVALGAPCIKCGSDDLVHLPLLRQLATLELPMILSTGMADGSEVADALDAVAGVPVILLHCVSSYPTRPAEVNMRRMTKLNGKNLVGYSDHTDGIDAAVGAVWLGACLIEKHFSLDRSSPGPDQAFSADPDQFAGMVSRIRLAEVMLGSSCVKPAESELAMRVTARRSIVASGPIAMGEIIKEAMLAYKRPGDGLPPSAADKILGRRAARALVMDEQIREGDWL